MFPPEFFDKNTSLNEDTMRNIVSLRESINLFDELSDDPEDQAVAIQVELETKKDIYPSTPATIHKGFIYNTAISYPYLTRPFLDTRFGDGSYGVWYGSLDLVTTIYETAYHMFNAILSTEDYPNIVKQERAVFTVHCRGILIDLTGNADKYPDMVSNDYSFCNLIGKKLQKEGHPGILYASARSDGVNLAVFNPQILSNPRKHCFLTYIFSTGDKKVRIEREVAKELLTIDAEKEFGL